MDLISSDFKESDWKNNHSTEEICTGARTSTTYSEVYGQCESSFKGTSTM